MLQILERFILISYNINYALSNKIIYKNNLILFFINNVEGSALYISDIIINKF